MDKGRRHFSFTHVSGSDVFWRVVLPKPAWRRRVAKKILARFGNPKTVPGDEFSFDLNDGTGVWAITSPTGDVTAAMASPEPELPAA